VAAHRFLGQLFLLIAMRAATIIRDVSCDPARTHAVLRFAFGVTVAFIASELLQWVPTFLAAVLVAVLLVNIPVRPPIKVAVGLLVIVCASALFAVVLSATLRGMPVILFGLAALMVFKALHAIAQGRPIIGPLMLIICVTAIPVVGLESQQAARAFAYALIRATGFAILVIWTSYLIWPRVMPRAPAPAFKLSREMAAKSALMGTAILGPLMLVYLMFGITDALPVLIATAMIVASMSAERGRKQALALSLANVAGGIASLVLFLLLAVHPSVFTLTLVILGAALAFGWRITAGDPMAAVVLIAFNAALIVFSSSLLSADGTFAIWMTRLTQFLIAGAFAVGMMTLLWPREE
jgi:hypothetical protein